MSEAYFKGKKVKRISPGNSTGGLLNAAYRLNKLEERDLIESLDWLDCGCSDGDYSLELHQLGAGSVTGIDIELERVIKAGKRQEVENKTIRFCTGLSELLPFPEKSFDGVWINEVLEHVIDERDTLLEIYRILRPGGHVALISPNRWFPFDGHGAKFNNFTFNKPAPILPWLPKAIGKNFMKARNYWPGELENLVSAAGFDVVVRKPILMVLEFYPWVPQPMIKIYRSLMPNIENIPGLRQFLAVSTLVIGQRPST